MKYHNNNRASSEEITATIPEYGTPYSSSQVKSCAKCYNQLAILIQNSKLQMLVQKFKNPKFFEVGRIVTQINKKPSESKYVSSSGKPPSSGDKSSNTNNTT